MTTTVTCPHCGAANDITNEKHESGTLLVCWSCIGVSVFTELGGVRKPDPVEAAAIGSTEELAAAVSAKLTDPDTEIVLSSHSWIGEENSSGDWYEFCVNCLRDKRDCLPNQFHGAISCDNGAWRLRNVLVGLL